MLGALYIGLSGMNAYTQGLQTISNNVANLNSPGYKSTAIHFEDLFGGGDAGLSYLGSANGHSIGNGVRLTNPLINFGQGDLRQTNNPLDLAIQGNGFLVVESNGTQYYARTGSFTVDADGYVTLSGSNYHLTVLDDQRQPSAVNIDDMRTDPPVATTAIEFADNLSSTGTTASVSELNVYDSNGGSQVWTVMFDAVGSSSPGEWNVTVKNQSGDTLGTGTVKFIGSSIDPTTSTLTITDSPTNADPLSVTLDFSNLTSFSSGTISSIRASSVDGKGVGTLTRVAITDDGNLELTYSNGETSTLGAVAIADFTDAQQLERVGNGLFKAPDGARARILPSDTEGVGRLLSGQLEASNVDLSQEFGDLILVQRGFQASSQVVGVTNDMIQELFGIRGRG